MDPFVTIKTFNDEEDFISFIDLLKNHQIPYQTEIFNSAIDSATLRPIEKEFIVKIRPADFQVVNTLLDDIAREAAKSIGRDHYLFGFTDSELYDIIIKPEEWSLLDYQLARKILEERGKVIDDTFLESIKKKSTAKQAEPEAAPKAWIFSGYLFSVLGGLIGIVIGWHLMTHTKILPDGTKVNSFIETDRRQGKRIFYLGIVTFVVMTILKLSDASAPHK